MEQQKGYDGDNQDAPPKNEITLATASPDEIKIAVRISELRAGADRAVIEDDDTYGKGLDLIKIINAAASKAEDVRTGLVKPMNDTVKAINSRFKTAISEPLENAKKVINDKCTTYAVKKATAEREAAAKIRREQEEQALNVAAAQEAAGDAEGANKTVEVAAKAGAKIEASAGRAVGVGGYTGAKGGLKKVWDYEVVDIAALATARPDLVEVNAGAFRAVMNDLIRAETIKADAIPGVVFAQKDQLNVR
jgi:hypothetical protein